MTPSAECPRAAALVVRVVHLYVRGAATVTTLLGLSFLASLYVIVGFIVGFALLWILGLPFGSVVFLTALLGTVFLLVRSAFFFRILSHLVVRVT
jgi:hypothetical protein